MAWKPRPKPVQPAELLALAQAVVAADSFPKLTTTDRHPERCFERMYGPPPICKDEVGWPGAVGANVSGLEW